MGELVPRRQESPRLGPGERREDRHLRRRKWPRHALEGARAPRHGRHVRARHRNDARWELLRLLVPAVPEHALPRREPRVLAKADDLVAPLRSQPMILSPGTRLGPYEI